MKTKTKAPAKRAVTAEEPERPSTIVKVRLWKDVLPVVRALAAVQTERDGDPITEAAVLEDALYNGLVVLEKQHLGSITLAESPPEPPETEGDYLERNCVTRTLGKVLSRARGQS